MAKTGNFGGSRHGIFPVGAGAAAASSISQHFDGDRAAASTTAQYAVLILAHAGHGVGEPVTGANQQDDEQKRGEIYDHPVAVVVWGGVLFVFCQALCGLRRPQPRSRDSLAKSQDARAAPGWGRFVGVHAASAYHGRLRYSTDPFGSTRNTGAPKSRSAAGNFTNFGWNYIAIALWHRSNKFPRAAQEFSISHVRAQKFLVPDARLSQNNLGSRRHKIKITSSAFRGERLCGGMG